MRFNKLALLGLFSLGEVQAKPCRPRLSTSTTLTSSAYSVSTSSSTETASATGTISTTGTASVSVTETTSSASSTSSSSVSETETASVSVTETTSSASSTSSSSVSETETASVSVTETTSSATGTSTSSVSVTETTSSASGISTSSVSVTETTSVSTSTISSTSSTTSSISVPTITFSLKGSDSPNNADNGLYVLDGKANTDFLTYVEPEKTGNPNVEYSKFMLEPGTARLMTYQGFWIVVDPSMDVNKLYQRDSNGLAGTIYIKCDPTTVAYGSSLNCWREDETSTPFHYNPAISAGRGISLDPVAAGLPPITLIVTLPPVAGVPTTTFALQVKDAADSNFEGRYVIHGATSGEYFVVEDPQIYRDAPAVKVAEFQLEQLTAHLMTTTGFYMVQDDAQNPNILYQVTTKGASQHYIRCDPSTVVKGSSLKCWREDQPEPTSADPFTYSVDPNNNKPISLSAPVAGSYAAIKLIVSDMPPPPAVPIPTFSFSLMGRGAADDTYNGRYVISGTPATSFHAINDLNLYVNDPLVQVVEYKLEQTTAYLMTASGLYVVVDDNGNPTTNIYQVTALSGSQKNIKCDPATVVKGTSIKCWRMDGTAPTGDSFTYNVNGEHPVSLVSADGSTFQSIQLIVSDVPPPPPSVPTITFALKAAGVADPNTNFNGRYVISGEAVNSYAVINDLGQYVDQPQIKVVEYKLQQRTARLMTTSGFYLVAHDDASAANRLYQVSSPSSTQHYITCDPTSVAYGSGIKCWREDQTPATPVEAFTYNLGSDHPISLTAVDGNFKSVSLVVSQVPPPFPNFTFALKGRDASDAVFNDRYVISGANSGSFQTIDDLRKYDFNVQPVQYKLQPSSNYLMTASGLAIVVNNDAISNAGGDSVNDIYQVDVSTPLTNNYQRIMCDPASIVKGTGIKCWKEGDAPATTDPFTYSTGSFHPISLTPAGGSFVSITLVVSDIPAPRVIPNTVFSLKVDQGGSLNGRYVIAGSQSGSYQSVNDISKFNANVQAVQYQLAQSTAFLKTANGMYVIVDDSHVSDNDGNSRFAIYQVSQLTTAAQHHIMCDPATIVAGSAINCWREGGEPSANSTPFTYSTGTGNPISLVAPNANFNAIALLVSDVPPPHV